MLIKISLLAGRKNRQTGKEIEADTKRDKSLVVKMLSLLAGRNETSDCKSNRGRQEDRQITSVYKA